MQMQARAGKEMFLEALIQRRLILRYAIDNNFHADARVKLELERARREILIGEARSQGQRGRKAQGVRDSRGV